MQLDEIQLDKIFGATAGDTDVSCLLFFSFTFSPHYHSYYYYYYLFGFHPFHSSKCILSRNPRAHALLVYGQDSLVHLMCRARSHIRGSSGVQAPGRTPAAPTKLHANASLHAVVEILLLSCSGCVSPRAVSLYTCKIHSPFFP